MICIWETFCPLSDLLLSIVKLIEIRLFVELIEQKTLHTHELRTMASIRMNTEDIFGLFFTFFKPSMKLSYQNFSLRRARVCYLEYIFIEYIVFTLEEGSHFFAVARCIRNVYVCLLVLICFLVSLPTCIKF